MKKFIILVFCFWIISSIHLDAYTTTGHDNFSKIQLNDTNYKILVDMTYSDIEKGYKSMSRRVFGWTDHYFAIKEEASYIGEVIFARSNRTSQKIQIDYKIKEVNTESRSIRTSGSISGNIAGKIKKIDAGIKASGDISVNNDKSYSRQEDMAFAIVIQPYYRVVFHVTGDALVTNGVSRYHAFGITFKKGSWEYVDVLTRYYEFYEEKIEQ